MKTSKNLVNEVVIENEVKGKKKTSKKVVEKTFSQIVPLSHYQFKFEEEKVDLTYSNNIKEKKERKTRKVSYEIPDYGTQSRKIYDYIETHLFDKNFTVYRVCQVLNTPSNNTRRIYFKFFAQKRDEFLLLNHLEKMELSIV